LIDQPRQLPRGLPGLDVFKALDGRHVCVRTF
jgi:hypothetical protein